MIARRLFIVALLSTGFAILSGCSANAPQYQATNANVAALAIGTSKVGVGEFALGPQGEKLNRLTLRGSSYHSPVENSWAAYLREALKSELINASRFDNGSSIGITGTLLENDLNAGTATGTAHIKAIFVVRRDGAVVYDSTLTIDKSWESSFIGAIAGPLAQQNYIAAISELLGKLFADRDFVQATK